MATVGEASADTSTVAGTGPVALLGRSTDGAQRPGLRRRFTPLKNRTDRFWSWVAPLVITFFAAGLHLWGVSQPETVMFDETYYAKDAYSLITYGYTRTFVDDGDDENGNEANELLERGVTDPERLFKQGDEAGPEMAVHPDVGKWMIGAGVELFGMNSFGWRFSAAITGALLILVAQRLTRRLTGSTLLACVAGLLLTFDGLVFVMSRIALLDVFQAFWVLCAVHCLVADRDWARTRIGRLQETTTRLTSRDWGPVRGLMLRPWRLLAGVSFGLACGTKWNSVYAVAVFGLLSWLWDLHMRRSLGVRFAWARSLLVDAIPAFMSIVVVALVVYVLSWMGWLLHADTFVATFQNSQFEEYGWRWGSPDTYGGNPQGLWQESVYALHALGDWHRALWDWHTAGIDGSTHSWQSDPGGWLLMNRPTGFWVESGGSDVILDCPAGKDCVSEVLAIGTPVLWWSAFLAMFPCLYWWVVRREWRFGVALLGLAATWLPWFQYSEQRPIFFFYGVVMIPFLVIGLTLVLGKILGPADAGPNRRAVGAAVVGAVVILTVVNFAYFYPILTDQTILNAEWNQRMWLRWWR